MYQRMAISTVNLSPAKTEHESDDVAERPVGGEEEQRGKHRHDDDHDGGDHRLAARRPGHLGDLGPHLLNKLEWIRSRHFASLPFRASKSLSVQLSCYSVGRSGGTRTPN